MNGSELEIIRQAIETGPIWLRYAEVVALVITAGLVCWYTISTDKLRRETQRQTNVLIRPLVIMDINSNIFFNNILSPIQKEMEVIEIPLQNIGKGTAFNIKIKFIPFHNYLKEVESSSYLDGLPELNTGSNYLEPSNSIKFYCMLLDIKYYQEYYEEYGENVSSILEINYTDINLKKCKTQQKIDKNGIYISAIE